MIANGWMTKWMKYDMNDGFEIWGTLFMMIEILKQLSTTNNHIGELKGVLNLLPNPQLILSLIQISESKDSSAIENIITTYDEIFKFYSHKLKLMHKYFI